MSDPLDGDLRRAFADLRKAEAASAPGYEDVRARRNAREPAGALLVAASLAAALIAGLAVRRAEPPAGPAATFDGWTAPTDFLLETPGREILHGAPGIGTGERTETP